MNNRLQIELSHNVFESNRLKQVSFVVFCIELLLTLPYLFAYSQI